MANDWLHRLQGGLALFAHDLQTPSLSSNIPKEFWQVLHFGIWVPE
tara:strand:+ start:492 stop:629 length:138 start_codon:yes stop_codon:yes gene_type:complete